MTRLRLASLCLALVLAANQAPSSWAQLRLPAGPGEESELSRATLGPPVAILPAAAEKTIPDKIAPSGKDLHKGHVPGSMPKGQHDGHGNEDENPLPHPHFGTMEKGPVLSLEELELLAVQNNPTLVQAAMQIEASRARALQARLWPNPKVGFIGEQLGVKGTAGEFLGGFVQQEIITAFKRKISSEKYQQQAQTAEFKAAMQQLKVLNGVRMHYFRTLAAGRSARLRQALFENATEEYRTHLELYNMGRRDKAEVLLAENRRNQARVDAVTEKNRYELMLRELAALIGVPDLPVSRLSDCLDQQSPPLEWETSLARLLQESPELLVARSHIAFEELSLQRERREPIPNITVRGSAGYNAEAKENVANVEVSLPLPVWNWNQGNIRLVEADLQRSIADLRRVELSLQKRLAHEFNKYQNALFLVQTFQKENIPNARKAYEIYLDQYKTRRISWDEVIRLHRNWLQVEMELTRNLAELRQQEVLINGLLIQDGLTEPAGPAPQGHIEVDPQPR